MKNVKACFDTEAFCHLFGGVQAVCPDGKGDTETRGPVWKLGSELAADEFLPTPEELEDLKIRLRIELDKLLEKEK